MNPSHRARQAGLVLLLVPLALLVVVRPLDTRLGLTGTYYSRVDWSGSRYSRLDHEISTAALRPTLRYAADRPFAVTWTGFLAVDRPGLYRFEIVSDDGSTVNIDHHRVIDISGRHEPLAGRGEMRLDRGVHPIAIDFYEAGGGWMIELFWARDEGELVRIPARDLLHADIGMTQFTALSALSRLATFVSLCWIAGSLLLLGSALQKRDWVRAVVSELRWAPLLTVMAATTLLSLLGVEWGSPEGWATDEMHPAIILGGLARFFSSGWYDRYPPFQFYVLGLFATPFILADFLRPSEPNVASLHAMLHIVDRLVSVAMASGTIIVCYFCGRALKDRLAGLLAASAMAVVFPFIYYSKVANVDVPYLFWLALAMFAYIRIITDAPAWSYRLFALTGVIAICTKDQAYGFFVLPALHVVWCRVKQIGVARLSTDRVLLSSGAIAIAAFVIFDNLIFNFSGFTTHLRVITGGASAGYEMVPSTAAGRMQLTAEVVRLIRWSFGWPLFTLVVAAIAASVVKRDRALWLLLPAFSYYLFFLNVVLYVYDRFLLGLCLLLAIIMGCRLAEWVRQRGAVRYCAIALAAIGFLEAVVAGASLDAMMIFDSRYAVQRWFRENVPHDRPITLIGQPEYLPVLDGFVRQYADPPRWADLAGEYVVVNTKYMRRFVPGTVGYEIYEKFRRGDGYSLVLRQGPSLGWLPLARDPAFRSESEDLHTNLTKVDPTIEVYRRK